MVDLNKLRTAAKVASAVGALGKRKSSEPTYDDYDDLDDDFEYEEDLEYEDDPEFDAWMQDTNKVDRLIAITIVFFILGFGAGMAGGS